MLSRIFGAMSSAGYSQFLGAFLWGIASVLLSPCGISTVPLVVGYVANTDNPSHWRAFKISCAFCLGIVINLLLVAFITSGISMLLGGYERFLTLITAGVFIVMGLHLLGVIRVKFFAFGRGGKGTESQNLKGAVILGVVSGLAVGPCSIAYVSPVLSLAMSRAAEGLSVAVGLVMSYALGYSAVLVFAGTFAQIGSEFLNSPEGSLTYWAVKVVNVMCGIALIVGGVYLVSEVRFFV